MENDFEIFWIVFSCCPQRWRAYRSHSAASIYWEAEDHFVTRDLRSAVLVVEVHVVGIDTQRGQIGPVDHNVHVV